MDYLLALLFDIVLVILLGLFIHAFGTGMYPNDEPNASTESNTNYLRDIYHTAFLLRQKLVPDLVPAILHHAGLFERHTHSTGRSHPWTITQNSAPSTCLTTPPIRSSARLEHPVRKVVFAINSRDQGWASNRDQGSWTWFTVAIVPKGTDLPEALSREDERSGKFIMREREIFRNEVARKELKTHIVEWSADSNDEEEARWVAKLENDDRIAVRAWAQFSGWTNHVSYVSVAVYTAPLIGDVVS